MNQIESLPYPLQSFYNNNDLTDKKIKNISHVYLIFTLILVVVICSAFAGIFASIIEQSMDMFRYSLIIFLLGNGMFHLMLRPKYEMLELLENSEKANIEKFNKLKNRQVATDYVKEYILPVRSIYLFDIEILEYVIAKEDIRQLMNRATSA